VIGIIHTGPRPPIFGDHGTEHLGGYSGVLTLVSDSPEAKSCAKRLTAPRRAGRDQKNPVKYHNEEVDQLALSLGGQFWRKGGIFCRCLRASGMEEDVVAW
jgi:hypothetical protein